MCDPDQSTLLYRAIVHPLLLSFLYLTPSPGTAGSLENAEFLRTPGCGICVTSSSNRALLKQILLFKRNGWKLPTRPKSGASAVRVWSDVGLSLSGFARASEERRLRLGEYVLEWRHALCQTRALHISWTSSVHFMSGEKPASPAWI